MDKGIIFNIQKFSLHDGPGIRTVVFFKGCPLRCKWCSNPESQSAKVQILWDKDKCRGCGTCVSNCPRKAIEATENGLVINHSSCIGCGTCVSNCATHAMKAEGEGKTIEEVMRVCRQDLDFYEESGGGVTLSGGEVLMHPDFAAALLETLKREHIHTAIETTGYASPETFRQVIKNTDLLLFDIKHWDEQKHIAGTGVSNRLTLENMKYAVAHGKEVLPRLPVIPGYNNTIDDAKGFVQRLREVNVFQVQLLPFHQFGEKKYAMLGEKYAFTDIPALHEEDLTEFKQVFLDAGIRAFF